MIFNHKVHRSYSNHIQIEIIFHYKNYTNRYFWVRMKIISKFDRMCKLYLVVSKFLSSVDSNIFKSEYCSNLTLDDVFYVDNINLSDLVDNIYLSYGCSWLDMVEFQSNEWKIKFTLHLVHWCSCYAS